MNTTPCYNTILTNAHYAQQESADAEASEIDSAIEHETGLVMRAFTDEDLSDYTDYVAGPILDAVRFNRPDVVGRIVCEVMRAVAKRIATSKFPGEPAVPDEDEALAKSIILEMIPEARNVK